MTRVHDRGGWPTEQPIDKSAHQISDWERKVDALVQVLGRKRVIRVDELRRAIEELPREQYEAMSYYERWADALERLLLEKNVVGREDLQQRIEESQVHEGRA